MRVKRLMVGLSVGGVLALFIAVVAGFVPRGACGSYFLSKESVPVDLGNQSINVVCTNPGQPQFFWAFIWVGVLFLTSAIVVQQVRAHRSEDIKRPVEKVRKAAVYVSGYAAVPKDDGQSQASSLAEQFERLTGLRDRGVLTPEEFVQAKARILGKG